MASATFSFSAPLCFRIERSGKSCFHQGRHFPSPPSGIDAGKRRSRLRHPATTEGASDRKNSLSIFNPYFPIRFFSHSQKRNRKMSSFRFYFAPIAQDFPRIEAAAFIFPVFRTVHTLRRFYVAFLHSVPRLFTGVLPVRRLGFRRLFFLFPCG